MTDTVDLLGRPPIMRPLPHPEITFEEDWKGEHHILNVPLNRRERPKVKQP